MAQATTDGLEVKPLEELYMFAVVVVRIRMLSETDLRADWPLLNPCVMLLPTTMKGSRWHFTPSYISLKHLKKIKTKDAYMYQR